MRPCGEPSGRCAGRATRFTPPNIEACLAFNDDLYNVKIVKKGLEGGHQRYLITLEGPALKRTKINAREGVRDQKAVRLYHTLQTVTLRPRNGMDTQPCAGTDHAAHE